MHLIKPVKKRLERYAEKNTNLVIDAQSGDEIKAPRLEFIHSVLHLVDNAFKFSPQDGKVDILIQPTGAGGVLIRIRDEGIGIPPGLEEKVFERYYQVSQGDSRAYGGLGVGLTIARAVARANGGDVQFIYIPSGCCVQLQLPPI
jgi:signal transduction histidine kinase